ncbi:MAG TPA: hypothetical protein VI612_05025 [Candidatus Nanoarchaeia archaeon]|nr:hypothetical protein [Candidatus Nanoarchaeia archaeon]
MDWAKLLYVVVIATLYVPMVFLGSNVFFPKYTGTESSPFYKDCYTPQRMVEQTGAKVDLTCTGAMPATGDQLQLRCSGASLQAEVNKEQFMAAQSDVEKCLEEQRQEQIAWEQERNKYDGWKYLSISLFNLVVILAVIFIGFKETVIMGLFFGAVAATFGATMRYWDYARTKIGFIVLVIIFFIVLYFINKRKTK